MVIFLQSLVNKAHFMIAKTPKIAMALAGFLCTLAFSTNLAFAIDGSEDDYAMWGGVWVGVKLIFTLIVIAGIFFFALGVIQLILTRFNGQELSQPIMFLVTGVVLVFLRVLAMAPICKFVIQQMFDGISSADATKIYDYYKDQK